MKLITIFSSLTLSVTKKQSFDDNVLTNWTMYLGKFISCTKFPK